MNDRRCGRCVFARKMDDLTLHVYCSSEGATKSSMQLACNDFSAKGSYPGWGLDMHIAKRKAARLEKKEVKR